jgi:glycerol-3-phosphate dehydrogenase
MAEKTLDKACEYLGVRQLCATATTTVPGVEQGYYWLGHRLHEVEENRLQSELVCECELVTRAMLENAVRNNPAITLDDLRRDVRLGMGPCQGGFCAYRAAGILHEMSKVKSQISNDQTWQVAYLQSPAHNITSSEIETLRAKSEIRNPKSEIANPNLLLRDFLQERWKGLVPILWGRQLKQERLDELIYLSLMNADHLPDAELRSPLTGFYQSSVVGGQRSASETADDRPPSTKDEAAHA